MEAVNDDFRSIFGGRSFMTAMCVALNHTNGSAHAVGAGHPPLLIVRHNGATESIPSVAPPLGLIERPKFVETPLDFKPEDAFLLYTDGLFGSSKNGERSSDASAAREDAGSLRPHCRSITQENFRASNAK